MKPILLLLLVSLCAAEVQNDKLPNDVVALLNSYDKDIAKIKSDADVAVQMRTDKLRPALIRAQEAATKKGDLDAAMAIKSEVNKLAKNEIKDAPLDAIKDGVGTWAIAGENYTISLAQNKTAMWKNPERAFVGSWSYDKKANALLITWNNGTHESVTVTDKDSAEIWEETSNGTRVKRKNGTRVEDEASGKK